MSGHFDTRQLHGFYLKCMRLFTTLTLFVRREKKKERKISVFLISHSSILFAVTGALHSQPPVCIVSSIDFFNFSASSVCFFFCGFLKSSSSCVHVCGQHKCWAWCPLQVMCRAAMCVRCPGRIFLHIFQLRYG